MASTVTILGGTGFVGSRLWPVLRNAGWNVTVASRRDPGSFESAVRHVACDLESGTGLDQALEGAEVAYYLVHGMAGGADFAAREDRSAENFQRAAARQRVDRVVYLGGLYPDGDLSDHLASRRHVGLRLVESSGALAIRAGLIVGAGGASFDILRGLCQRLPLMLAPRWLASRCQPIGIHDTVAALAGAARVAGAREVDLVGPDVLSYRRMLEITAGEIRGREPVMFPVPLLSPELSAHWLRLVTKVDMNVARSLVASLRHDMVAGRPLLTSELGLSPASFRATVRTALDESN